MRWPDTCKLMDRIRRERPETSVDHHASPGAPEHSCLRDCCLKKGPGGTGTVPGFHLVPGSIDTIFGPNGWGEPLRRHPEPWCATEECRHAPTRGHPPRRHRVRSAIARRTS